MGLSNARRYSRAETKTSRHGFNCPVGTCILRCHLELSTHSFLVSSCKLKDTWLSLKAFFLSLNLRILSGQASVEIRLYKLIHKGILKVSLNCNIVMILFLNKWKHGK